MRILSIESSCDETSAAVLEKTNDKINVLSNITATSLLIHAKTGGIIPENAARMQVKYIMPVIVEALIQSEGEAGGKGIPSSARSLSETNSKDVGWKGSPTGPRNSSDGGVKWQNPQLWTRAKEFLKNDIDAIAVTYGPGLIGSLLVGVETAKTLSYIFDKPLIPVNHLLAHLYANFIQTSNSKLPTPNFPFIGLIVSGGHTDLLYFETHDKYQWLGGTRDDAAGEAFDKIGRLLNLSYPAGPEIERRSALVDNQTIKFQSPMIYSKDFDFSFSGLKAEVMRYVKKNPNMNDELKNQICFATQKAIIDVLVKKTLDAAEKYNCKTILVGGGVSANQTFREQLNLQSNILFPEKQYSTDNAAMIGAYALKNYKPVDWQNVNANPELYFA